jgi:hypothetical protein
VVVQLPVKYTNRLSRRHKKSEFLSKLVPFLTRLLHSHKYCQNVFYGQQGQHRKPAHPTLHLLFACLISCEALVSVSGGIYGCTKVEAMMILRKKPLETTLEYFWI